jgi:hypothetical protein
MAGKPRAFRPAAAMTFLQTPVLRWHLPVRAARAYAGGCLGKRHRCKCSRQDGTTE